MKSIIVTFLWLIASWGGSLLLMLRSAQSFGSRMGLLVVAIWLPFPMTMLIFTPAPRRSYWVPLIVWSMVILALITLSIINISVHVRVKPDHRKWIAAFLPSLWLVSMITLGQIWVLGSSLTTPFESVLIGRMKALAAKQADHYQAHNRYDEQRPEWAIQISHPVWRIIVPHYENLTDIFELNFSVSISDMEWKATAIPVIYRHNAARSFYVDESGVVRCDDLKGQLGDRKMPICE